MQGLLGGTPDADRRIGYLAKYLTKSMTEAHESASATKRNHVDLLHAALTVEPCSPACANWLRYGIQPKNARPGLTPGGCRSKAHKREHLGYAGRRILVSRKWSGKTLADHRHDRRAWVLATLGVTDQAGDMRRDRYEWERADPDDPVRPLATRLLHAIAQRQRWRAAYEAAKRGDPPPLLDGSTGPPGVKDALTPDGPNSATPTHGRETAA